MNGINSYIHAGHKSSSTIIQRKAYQVQYNKMAEK